jgi:DNA invertase Pin-like site-specific DNA recombinase
MRRAGIQQIFRQIKSGQADGFIVTRLDRMSRSVHDASQIFQRAAKEGFAVVMLDPMVDTSTPYGLAFAQVAAVFAELERGLISQRTKEALAEKRKQGIVGGRPTMMSPEVDERIFSDKEAGLSWRQIAQMLEEDGILPPFGKFPWRHSTLQGAVARHLRKISS